jgi:hypothetical protein
MLYIPRIATLVLALTFASAAPAGDKQALPAAGEKAAPPRMLRIGAVAYAPSAVTVFQDLRRYFAKHTWTLPGTRLWPTPATTCCATVRARRW